MTSAAPPNRIAAKKSALDKRLRAVIEDYSATNDQLITLIDASLRSKLERKLELLEAEMEALEAQMREVGRLPVMMAGQTSLPNWEPELVEIDFVDAWGEFHKIFHEQIHREAGGAVLLLLPDYDTMCAHLLVQRIRRWLSVTVDYGALRECFIQITDFSQLTSEVLLKKLGSYFPDPMPPASAGLTAQQGEVQVYTRQLVNRIGAALDSKQVLYIEVSVAPQLYLAYGFLAWLLDEFWAALTRRLLDEPSTAGEPPSKCIFLVTTSDPIPNPRPEQLAARFCPARDFCDEHRDKLVPLTLKNWAESDIKYWLQRCFRWDVNIVQERAHLVYARSQNGSPIYALHSLRNILSGVSF